jgi:hypothetical protein
MLIKKILFAQIERQKQRRGTLGTVLKVPSDSKWETALLEPSPKFLWQENG